MDDRIEAAARVLTRNLGPDALSALLLSLPPFEMFSIMDGALAKLRSNDAAQRQSGRTTRTILEAWDLVKAGHECMIVARHDHSPTRTPDGVVVSPFPSRPQRPYIWWFSSGRTRTTRRGYRYTGLRVLFDHTWWTESDYRERREMYQWLGAVGAVLV